MANIYDMIDTWNNGATTFTAIKMDVLDSASAANSLLLDLKVDGVTKASINKDGGLTVTTADINGGTIDDTVIGGSTAAAGTFTTLTASGDMNIDSGTLFVDASANAVGIGTSSPTSSLDMGSSTSGEQRISWSGSASIFPVRGGNSLCLSRGYKSSTSVSGTFVGAVTGSLRPSMITLDGSSSSGRGITFYTDPTTSLVENATVTPSERMHIGNGGDISFYEDTGTTAKLFWDASAERLGIGTSSPETSLDITGSGLQRLQIESTTNDLAGIKLYRNDRNQEGVIQLTGDTLRISAVTNDSIAIRTNNTERVRIDSSGHLIVPNGITLGTAVGTYAAANTLDDYEEGTWTPAYEPETGAFGAITYDSITKGAYVKIGNQVFFWGSIRTDAITVGTASGLISVTGLPFAASSSGSRPRFSGVSINYAAEFTNFPIGSAGPDGGTGATYFYFYSGTNFQSLEVSDMKTGGNDNNVFFSGVYYTN